MADGIIGNSEGNTQLFRNDGSFGFGGKPVITLFLDALYTIDSIEIYGGPVGNQTPGNFNSANITIDGMTQFFLSVGFGPIGANRSPINDRMTLTGSTLDGKITNMIVISSWLGGGNVSITEIRIQGTLAPEPASLVLVRLGLDLLVVVRKRLKKQSA